MAIREDYRAFEDDLEHEERIYELSARLPLSADLRKDAEQMTRLEARYLVDAYYDMQEQRKAAAHRARKLDEAASGNNVMTWLRMNNAWLEVQIAAAIGRWVDPKTPRPKDPMWRTNQWTLAQAGLGPILTAFLATTIDIERAPTAGHIWSFAGLDPAMEWNKGEKRPYNAALKTACWKLGESFVKSGKFYRERYDERKKYESNLSESGSYTEFCAEYLKKRAQSRKDVPETQRKLYAAGKLPPSHIHARAKRWTVKLFLSHWHEVAYEEHFGKKPPAAFAISQLGHAHYIPPPGR